MARDFKIELDNVEMINGSDDLLKDTKVTKVTLTGENKLNSLNSTFENCTELTAIEGDVNLDGVSDMTEMALNTPLDELKVTNPTEENIQTDNSLNQVTNVKIGGTKYAKGGIQDVVGSLEWNAENFAYEDAILDNVYTNSSSIEDNKSITVSDTLEQKATSIEITGQTYENLVNGKATENLLDEMSMQQTEGKPTQFTPHMEQPICLEYIEGQTYQNLVDGKGEKTLISEYSPVINDFIPNTFKPPQNQPICLEYMEGETYQNLIKGKGEYKLTDTFSATWTESNNSVENPPAIVEVPEIFGNTVQGFANCVTTDQIVTSLVNTINTGATSYSKRYMPNNSGGYVKVSDAQLDIKDFSLLTDECFIQLKPDTTYSYRSMRVNSSQQPGTHAYSPSKSLGSIGSGNTFTTDSTGKVILYPQGCQDGQIGMKLVEGEYGLGIYPYDYDLNVIQSVGDLYVNGRGEPILDGDGNEQYKLEIESSGKNLFCDEILKEVNKIEYNEKTCYIGRGSTHYNSSFQISNIFKANTQYTISFNVENPNNATWATMYIQYSDFQYATPINFANTNTNRIVLTSREGYSISHIYATAESGKYLYLYNIQLEENSATEYEPYQLNKTTILMPCQLSKLSDDVCDKLYYDLENNKYIVNKIVGSVTHDFNINKSLIVNMDTTDCYSFRYNSDGGTIKKVFSKFKSTTTENFTISNKFLIDSSYNISYNRPNVKYKSISLQWDNSYPRFYTIKSHDLYSNTDEFITDVLNQSPITFYSQLATTEIIETKILEKPSLETYSPKTYLSTNTEIQPSKMTITNKEVKFMPLSLQPSKSYTVQLDSVGKNNKPITVNLGGATTTIQPTNDTSKHHRVSITTPSELTTDNLNLSGEGVIVNDVMLFEGNTSVIKQDVDYMDGIQSIGELFESRNLFDYAQSELGLLDHTNGKISEDNSWKYTTDFIPVEPNTTYCISQTSGSVFNYKIVEYNSSKGYLKGTNWTSSKGTDINRAYNTFTTSANTYYLRLGWQSSIFEIQLEEDTFPTEFMAFDTVRYKLEIQTYDSRWDSI